MKEELDPKAQWIAVLPDDVANQIAAGEVVQRPASIVKELVENAVDAGATEIEVFVSDGGRHMVQVRDNGCGMSDLDARLAFERHATSKIKTAQDLFNLHTKGFRGEALASIAAVAQVELVTCRRGAEEGARLVVENSKVVVQEAAPPLPGSCFTVKQLFFSVPARRKFLKSARSEMGHVQEEFQRVALIHPEISFVLQHDKQVVYKLPAGSFKKRISDLFGAGYQEKLVDVKEDTSVVRISGFLVKPQFARKTRGEQYFFVNGRFIKSPALHHAVRDACKDMMSAEAHPGYFIRLEVDPNRLDVNIHPTKTEVKFEDERMIYTLLKSTVRQALGKSHVAPVLDFEQEQAFEHLLPKDLSQIRPPEVRVNPDYNPFESTKASQKPKDWDDFYAVQSKESVNQPQLPGISEEEEQFSFFQIKKTYLVVKMSGQLLILDQHRAHARVLYERLQKRVHAQKRSTQLSMFTETLSFQQQEYPLVVDMLPHLQAMGFDVEEFGPCTLVFRGVPPEAQNKPLKDLMERLMEDFKHQPGLGREDRLDSMLKRAAANMAVKAGYALKEEEAAQLVKDLMRCRMPWVSVHGKPVIVSLKTEELDERFGK